MASFDASWDEVINVEEMTYQNGFNDGKQLDCSSHQDEEVINAHSSGYRNSYLIGVECSYYVNISEYIIQNRTIKTNNIINLVNSKAKLLLQNISNLPDDNEMEDYEAILGGIRSLYNQCDFSFTGFNVSKNSANNSSNNNNGKSLEW